MPQALKRKATEAWVASRATHVNHCPNCKVTNIRWRVRKQLFICNRCGQEFDEHGNMLPLTPPRKGK
jgi:ribosomal protein L37AE/L43A